MERAQNCLFIPHLSLRLFVAKSKSRARKVCRECLGKVRNIYPCKRIEHRRTVSLADSNCFDVTLYLNRFRIAPRWYRYPGECCTVTIKVNLSLARKELSKMLGEVVLVWTLSMSRDFNIGNPFLCARHPSKSSWRISNFRRRTTTVRLVIV